jgi:uncharacterized membrane protein YhaH (DUF805 family)
MNLMFEPLRRYADFNGRARRSEYWLFWLFTLILELVVSVIIGITGGDPMSMNLGLGGILFCIIVLGLFVPSLAVLFRRLHDTDRSAWWILIACLPLIGALVLLVFTLLDGTPGPNRFGPDPKARAGDPLDYAL